MTECLKTCGYLERCFQGGWKRWREEFGGDRTERLKYNWFGVSYPELDVEELQKNK